MMNADLDNHSRSKHTVFPIIIINSLNGHYLQKDYIDNNVTEPLDSNIKNPIWPLYF